MSHSKEELEKIQSLRSKVFTADSLLKVDSSAEWIVNSDYQLYKSYGEKYFHTKNQWDEMQQKSDMGDFKAMMDMTSKGQIFKRLLTKSENEWNTMAKRLLIEKALMDLIQLDPVNEEIYSKLLLN